METDEEFISRVFNQFCLKLRMDQSKVDCISNRYKTITKILNRNFWNSESDTLHSLYVGSYGRGTDIHTSDVDILFQLPYEEYLRYNRYDSNGQSALLQDVRNILRKTYSTSEIGGDGQVVKVDFSDGICFEIVPCFINVNNSFTYPDTNHGGSWKITNPKPEIQAIIDGNKRSSGNLKRLCRMARAWKDNCNVPMGGLLIDTLASRFMESYVYYDESYNYYDWMTRDFFEYLSKINDDQSFWYAVGSNQHISKRGPFAAKAKKAYSNALYAIKFMGEGDYNNATYNWREIYGSKFPIR